MYIHVSHRDFHSSEFFSKVSYGFFHGYLYNSSFFRITNCTYMYFAKSFGLHDYFHFNCP